MYKKLLPIILFFIILTTFLKSQENSGNFSNNLIFSGNSGKLSLFSDRNTKSSQNQLIGNKIQLSLSEKNHSNRDNMFYQEPAVLKLKESTSKAKKRHIDVYFHNFYDSYQENYIANFIGHVHFGVGPGFYMGPYLDVYADSKSSKALIYNDRFVEIGFFLRYYFFQNLYFEGRIGYTRQIDLDSNKINFKPMLVYFYRFGEPVFKRTKSTDPKTSLYLDIYYAAMYDYKYKNAFLQGILTQALRFSLKGYSYFENYLFESGQFDGRKVDYNNYFEIGTGVRFKPNMLVGPVIFVEPTYKVYFYGDRKNSFQLKAGFILNFFLDI
ncbi:MAG: hypothetical protein UZ05_CHB002002827 [Chlorobi bacterium OLB5]|nr:MAG: hypothetical protein UZ05_CHB002002827 [Chlorobi bacterium OLB5]